MPVAGPPLPKLQLTACLSSMQVVNSASRTIAAVEDVSMTMDDDDFMDEVGIDSQQDFESPVIKPKSKLQSKPSKPTKPKGKSKGKDQGPSLSRSTTTKGKGKAQTKRTAKSQQQDDEDDSDDEPAPSVHKPRSRRKQPKTTQVAKDAAMKSALEEAQHELRELREQQVRVTDACHNCHRSLPLIAGV